MFESGLIFCFLEWRAALEYHENLTNGVNISSGYTERNAPRRSWEYVTFCVSTWNIDLVVNDFHNFQCCFSVGKTQNQTKPICVNCLRIELAGGWNGWADASEQQIFRTVENFEPVRGYCKLLWGYCPFSMCESGWIFCFPEWRTTLKCHENRVNIVNISSGYTERNATRRSWEYVNFCISTWNNGCVLNDFHNIRCCFSVGKTQIQTRFSRVACWE